MKSLFNICKAILIVALLSSACEEKKQPRPEEVVRVTEPAVEAGIEIDGEEDPCEEIDCEDCEIENCPDHPQNEEPVEGEEEPECLEEPCETEDIVDGEPDAGVPEDDQESIPG